MQSKASSAFHFAPHGLPTLSLKEITMLRIKLSLLAVGVLFAWSQSAEAQVYYQDTHLHSVPHTTTHTDYVPHNGHLHAVPHTTTHFDQVPHTTYRPLYQQQYVPQQQYIPQQQYVPQQQYIPQTNYYPPQQGIPHTTTHFDNVPHTTTHTDYIPHNGHLHAVPHTTTHYDQVPHTTTHFHN